GDGVGVAGAGGGSEGGLVGRPRRGRGPAGRPAGGTRRTRRGHTGDVAEHSTPETIRVLLSQTRTWAVVGCSPDPRRDSHRIARLLQERGFRVIPVNPNAETILGERCYPSVRDLPDTARGEVVVILRRGAVAGALASAEIV